jgi:hypothetical protein
MGPSRLNRPLSRMGGADRQTGRQARPGSCPFWVSSREVCCFPGNLVSDRQGLAAWDYIASTQWNYIPTESPCCFTGSGGEWIPVIFPLTTQQVTNARLSLVAGRGASRQQAQPWRMEVKTTGLVHAFHLSDVFLCSVSSFLFLPVSSHPLPFSSFLSSHFRTE